MSQNDAVQITDNERKELLDLLNEAINSWLQNTRGIPITLQLTKLGLSMASLMEKVYLKGKSQGQK
jgi:hypothetical protein